MRRSIKYIVLALVAVVWTVACVNEMELSEPILEQQQLTLVPRVHSFANQYVTKANPYGSSETKISQLIVLVFNNKGGLAHIQHHTIADGVASSVSLNKSMLNLPQAKIVLIANMPLAKIAKTTLQGSTTETTTLADVKEGNATLTLSDLQNYSFHYEDVNTVITDLGDSFSGFPMIGTVSGVDLVAGNQEAIEVAMKILYAKINFVIGVDSSTENTNTSSTTPSFKLTGYSVYNASKATLIADPTATADSDNSTAGNVPTASDVYAYENTDPNAAANANNLGRNVPSSNLSFTFYVSESRFNHGISDETLANIYPSWIADLSNSEQDTELKNSVMQKYKPVLATYSEEAQPGKGLATFVLLKGDYTDYRGTVWNVNYKVYLGKDNTQNFQVDRNSEYINKITIKGIRNYDAEDGRGEVWIDHRVDVEGTDSAAECVTITRETLIDAHIEVRPLRVSWPEEKFSVAKLYLPTDGSGNLWDWIGIERFIEGVNNQDASVYCFQTTAEGERKSTGKRRYFTETLISELQNKDGDYGVLEESDGRKYIYLNNGECAWIYFDEYTEGIPNEYREAKITLQFFPTTGSKIVTEEYHIRQRGLQNVGGYSIESYEEYLHTYDSADDYNLSTSPVDYTQKGLAWGKEGEEISKYIVVSAGPRNSWYLLEDLVTQRYDYFHKSDQPSGNTYYYSTKDAADNWIDAKTGTGLIFTDRASYNEGITVKDMGTLPENAYQYCLSKNKFAVDEDGNVSMIIHWYLPDVYEMQSVLTANQNSGGVADFATDASYWSSQPSFTTSGIEQINFAFVDENIEKARAVSSSGISDQSRSMKNRIRCLYSKDGLTADMADRTPDGVGGNYTFTMKGNPADGYFNYLVPSSPENKESTSYEYNYDIKGDAEPDFPEKSNSYNVTAAEFEFLLMTDAHGTTIEGFAVDPSIMDNWTEYLWNLQTTGYYTTLATFPGLTQYTLTKYTNQEAYRPTTTPKTAIEVIEESSRIEFLKELSQANDLKTLDHVIGGDMFQLTINKADGNSIPSFVYNELVSGTTTTNTQYWIPPKYKATEISLTPDGITRTARGTAEQAETTKVLGIDQDYQKQQAFQQAYKQAKTNAISELKKVTDIQYPGWTYNESLIRLYPENLEYDDPENEYLNYEEETTGPWYNPKTIITCTVTIDASLQGQDYLYVHESGGVWENNKTEIETSGTELVNDELRMYCGNSFTISLPQEYQDEYEITKVKVYYSGSNLVGKKGGRDLPLIGLVGEDKVYARFVDSDIIVKSIENDSPIEETVLKDNRWLDQPAETLKLEGMDYSDGTGGGWHQWSRAGTEEITLVLAHYEVADNYEEGSFTYSYYKPTEYLDKYIVVDKIEVKCTPKKTTDETTP